MPKADHPIWNIVRLIVMMTALTMILWLTASKFDSTEVKTIIGMFVASSGVEFFTKLFQGKGE